MGIETISAANLQPLTELMLELWNTASFEEEYENCQKMMASEKETCYLIKVQNSYIAFIYLTLRTDYVEGAITSPIAYIEGLYVKPPYRGQGIGKKLVDLGEAWGLQKGCKQYASDAELSNADSLAFHESAGFKEANRIVCFIKDITQT